MFLCVQVIGDEELRLTTLRDLGLTGGQAALRLSYRVATGIPEQRQPVTIDQPSAETEKPQIITKEPPVITEQLSSSSQLEQPSVDKEEELMEVEENQGASLEEKVMNILSSPALLASLAETALQEHDNPSAASMVVDSQEEPGEY